LVGAAAAYFSAELTLDANSYWRFLVWYVIVGILWLAVLLPMVPRRFLAGAPEFLFAFGLVESKKGGGGSGGGASSKKTE
jgi:hypothetical protein